MIRVKNVRVQITSDPWVMLLCRMTTTGANALNCWFLSLFPSWCYKRFHVEFYQRWKETLNSSEDIDSMIEWKCKRTTNLALNTFWSPGKRTRTTLHRASFCQFSQSKYREWGGGYTKHKLCTWPYCELCISKLSQFSSKLITPTSEIQHIARSEGSTVTVTGVASRSLLACSVFWLQPETRDWRSESEQFFNK